MTMVLTYLTDKRRKVREMGNTSDVISEDKDKEQERQDQIVVALANYVRAYSDLRHVLRGGVTGVTGELWADALDRLNTTP